MGDIEGGDGAADLAKGRSERHALLMIWGAIILIGFLIFLFGQYQAFRSKASLDWPTTSGEIVVSRVTKNQSEEGVTYSADIEYSYTVDGERYSSNVVVIGGHDYSPRDVVSRYSVGNEVLVAYDPVRPHKAVLEPGKLTNGTQQFGLMMMGGALFMAALIDFIFRRSLNEELNLFDHVMIISFKIVFFPFWYLKGNLWILGAMVGLAGWLSTLDGSPVITVPLMFFAAFYGVLGALLLWCRFMGWVYSFQDDGSGASDDATEDS